jgi:hypothetical protein
MGLCEGLRRRDTKSPARRQEPGAHWRAGSGRSRRGGLQREVARAALRIAIADATLGVVDVDPDRASFTIALNTARDQLIAAAGVIADTVIDLVGVIGRDVLDNLMPARRLRTTPRVVKRAISNYTVKTAKGPGTRTQQSDHRSRSTSSRQQTLDNGARRPTTWHWVYMALGLRPRVRTRWARCRGPVGAGSCHGLAGGQAISDMVGADAALGAAAACCSPAGRCHRQWRQSGW